MPIKGLSEQKRLPRQGKIRLGIKKKNAKGTEYPASTDYFVCPSEVQAVYGEKPKKLDVIIPLEDEEIWASQYYRQYSRSRGLVCKGDGETCRRMLDKQTGDVAGRDTKEVVWQEGGECAGKNCPDYQGKACQEVMNLQFLLPKVPGLGIWQIDTGSIHSIMNINNCATMIRAMCGRVSWIPLSLTLEPTEVVNPEDGRKKTVYCMQLRYERSAESLLMDSEKPRLQVLLPAPRDDEAPDDREFSIHTPEKTEEAQAKAKDDIDELWPKQKEKPPPKPKTPPDATGQVLQPEPEETKGDVPEETESSPFGEAGSHINMEWLKEQLAYLQGKGQKAWSNRNVASYLQSITGKEASSITEAIGFLTLEQADAFVKEIQERVELA